MPLSHRSRSALYDRLSPIIGDDEVVEEFLSQFPARDLEEPVSKEFHRAESVLMRADLRREMAALRADIQALRVEMHKGFRTATLSLGGLMVAMSGVMVAAITVAA